MKAHHSKSIAEERVYVGATLPSAEITSRAICKHPDFSIALIQLLNPVT